MQTTQPLSQQELALLDRLRGNSQSFAGTVFFIGLAVTLLGTVLFTLIWDQVPIIARFAIVGFIIIGLLAMRAVSIYFKNKKAEVHPSHGYVKQVYSGVLIHTEVIREEYVRYHFNGFSVEAWIAAPKTGHPKPHFSDVPKIGKFTTMTNLPVTLSVARLEPGIDVVVGATYDQQHYTASTQPMDVEDKKKLLKSGRYSAGCFIYVASFLFILFNVVSKFNLNTFLFTSAFLVIPALFCIRHLYRTAGKNVQASGNKIVVKTIITEKLHQYISTTDSDVSYSYLRLGDGWLTEISGAKSYKSKCNPGDEVVLEYAAHKSGGRGTLLEIRNA